MKNSIVLSLLAAVLVIGLMTTPAMAEKPDTPGGPFQELWTALNEAVASLQSQINGIQEYLQQHTETDPIYSASPASGIENIDITNWDNAYSWGDHSTAGYATVSQLGAEATTRIAADAALQSQIPKLGAWQTKSINTVYRAATDGFVVARANTGGDGVYLTLRTDSANPPTTMRAHENASVYDSACITMPVRKGDYWKVETWSTAINRVYWIPFGS